MHTHPRLASLASCWLGAASSVYEISCEPWRLAAQAGSARGAAVASRPQPARVYFPFTHTLPAALPAAGDLASAEMMGQVGLQEGPISPYVAKLASALSDFNNSLASGRSGSLAQVGLPGRVGCSTPCAWARCTAWDVHGWHTLGGIPGAFAAAAAACRASGCWRR